LRELGLPFAVREHAVALVLHQQKALALPRGYAFGETYMRLACRADLRSLYWLMRADALAGRDEGGVAAKLEDFRRQAEALEVFGRPPRPPLDAPKLRALGFEDDAERHRALNALRYFRLVARMYEEQWHTERMRQELATPRGRLHLLVGPAASGKSRWAIEHLAGIHIVSSDQMREELTGDPADQSQNYLVFQRCMDRIRRALHEGRPVAFDATNYCEALRTMPVQAARWSGAEIVSYFFDGGLELALMRNRERRRQVPEDVIRKQHRLLESPALYEADRHMVVYPDGRAEQYWPSPPA
jgi:predicted kinase